MTHTHSHSHAHTHDWDTYYKNHKGVTPSNIALHWQYLLSIISSRPKNLLEIGCGPADHSAALRKLLPKAEMSLLDSDANIISKLKKEYSGQIKKFYVCDITKETEVKKHKFSPDEFDVIYSQGLMEHFKDKDFISTVKNFMPYTKKMVMSIPADTYPSQDYGDEILRSGKELEVLCGKIPGISYKVKKYLPDVGVRTKAIVVKNKNYTIFESLLFMLFGSCHYLVELKKKV